MFRKILVPTDGSARSRKAAQHAVSLAKATGGSIVAFHVAPAYSSHAFEDYVRGFVMPADYAKNARRVAKRRLAAVRDMAGAAHVPFSGRYAIGPSVAEAIAAASKRLGCDTIVMASHGRQGVKKVLLGSETQAVLSLVKIPVVVTR